MSPTATTPSSFPCSLTIRIPFPTPHLARTALRALAVDQELSPLVRRSFSLARPPISNTQTTTTSPTARTTAIPREAAPPTNGASRSHEPKVSPRTGGPLRLGPTTNGAHSNGSASTTQGLQQDAPQPLEAKIPGTGEEETVLETQYSATTNRMLRVAVNGFFESVGVVVACMRELDVDVVEEEWIGEGVAEVDGLARVQGLEETGVIG